MDDQDIKAAIMERVETARMIGLIARFLKYQLSEEEKDQLDEWILASDHNMAIFEVLTDEINAGALRELAAAHR